METPAGFANHGAFVSCVAHLKDGRGPRDGDTRVLRGRRGRPEPREGHPAAERAADKAERAAAKAERKAERAAAGRGNGNAKGGGN